MTRIIVHAGFYKTGTTSLQSFLSKNRAALAPWFDYYGPGDLGGAGRAAHLYAERPFVWRRARFRRILRRFLTAMPAPASGTVVISREGFTGLMPGHGDWRRHTVTGFPHAETLTRLIAGEITRRFGPSAQVEFLLTTRARESWLASIHGHLLRSIRLTDDPETFAARFPATLSPAAEAARLAQALAPLPIHTAALEDLALRPEGPVAALLDLVKIPPAARATLRPVPPANAGQEATLRAAFLDLNRQGLPRAALKSAKQKLLHPPR